MTSEEIRTWLRGLGTNNSQRVLIIEDMLRNAVHDRMSTADKQICAEALQMLKVGE